jgi:ATP-dependent RNA helicase DHX8/PRP22
VAQEERRVAARAASGSNATPLIHVDERRGTSAKRLSSPERFEIKQLIASGAVNAADVSDASRIPLTCQYPDIDEDFNAAIANPEIEQDIDIEVNEIEPSFLSGQTKITLELSPVKIIKAPDGSLNRAAMAGASLAKERRDLKRLEQNESADSDSRDVNQPWLDPMARQNERQFASDVKGNLLGQKAAQTPAWKAANKISTYGKITSLSIQEQRRSLPIYKLRDQLVQAVREVSHFAAICTDLRTKFSLWSATLVQAKPPRWPSTSPRRACWNAASSVALNLERLPQSPSPSAWLRKWAAV